MSIMDNLTTLENNQEPLTRVEAERLTEGIRIALDRTSRGIADLQVRVAEAYHRRADLALGYESWAEYAQSEFGELTQSLAAPIRRELVGYLSAEGMSTRAIAPAVGKDFSTVSRDIQRVEVLQDATPALEPTPEPEFGWTHPGDYNGPKSWDYDDEDLEPRPQPSGLTLATSEGVVITEQRHVDITPEPAPAPAPRKVTGLDGKTYTPPKPKETPKPRRNPLPEQFFRARYDLNKKAESLERLTADDRFNNNKEKVARENLSDLNHAIETLQRIVAALQN